MIIKSYKLFIRDSFLSDTIFLNNKISVKTNFSICDIIGQLLYSIFFDEYFSEDARNYRFSFWS